MRRAVLLALAASLLPALATLAAADAAPTVRRVDFNGTVTPISAERVVRTIDDAEAAGDDAVLIVLDTPGGLVSSMETIVKRQLAARVPVVVWVGPSGARAASAGFYILIAGDVAAMAPGTRTGASSVITMGGDNSADNVVLRKANEDKAALLRSIAERRGRNPQVAERAVFEARAFEESVALEEGLIDEVAGSVEELLAVLDGREVTRFDGETVTLHTANARIVETEFGLRHRFFELLANPTLAMLLLLLGLAGLWIEATHPGLIVPGVLGALSLALFVMAGQLLPISGIGVMLVLLAIALFILEIKVTSYGLLSLAATTCLVLGLWMLIDGPIPALRVPFLAVLPVALAVVGCVGLAVSLAVRAQRQAVGTGVEGMMRESGVAAVDLDPEGTVRVHGEIWNAVAAGGVPIPAGTAVRVVGVDDLRLTVEAVGADRLASGGD